MEEPDEEAMRAKLGHNTRYNAGLKAEHLIERDEADLEVTPLTDEELIAKKQDLEKNIDSSHSAAELLETKTKIIALEKELVARHFYGFCR